MLSALQVTAVAYDNPIPGFKTDNTINLRLWAAKPDREFDLEAFNTGDYVQVAFPLLSRWHNARLSNIRSLPVPDSRPSLQAILQRQRAETLSSVLYPGWYSYWRTTQCIGDSTELVQLEHSRVTTEPNLGACVL